jgi:hypothetical protein
MRLNGDCSSLSPSRSIARQARRAFAHLPSACAEMDLVIRTLSRGTSSPGTRHGVGVGWSSQARRSVVRGVTASTRWRRCARGTFAPTKEIQFSGTVLIRLRKSGASIAGDVNADLRTSNPRQSRAFFHFSATWGWLPGAVIIKKPFEEAGQAAVANGVASVTEPS